ncbi:Nucleoside-diphosphate-sugar pyrophosphorylase [Candidatus Terasakiella magnetica]|nr:Nucleoside-diphosphate-sugar pyrophosphorylase [Candidatus Terasakiella magnetica]
MKDWRNTLIGPGDRILQAIEALDKGALRIVLVVDGDGRLLGTVTDGDIRRGILRGLSLDLGVTEVMNRRFHSGLAGTDRHVLLAGMRRDNLQQLPLLDGEGRVVGLETIEDILHLQERDNWVVLMAGGEGRRLYPLTESTPKPLLAVGSKPILETILDRFIEAGFRRFFISVNYLAHRVEAHFGDGSSRGVEIAYLREDSKLGTAGALRLLPSRPDKPVFVMNGDILTNVDFGRLLAFHAEQAARATMCVREHALTIPYGVVELNGSRVASIAEKPEIRNFVNAGIYVLDPAALDFIPPEGSYNMTQLFDSLLAQQQACAAFPIREYWLDIGRHDDFERANVDFDEFFK